MFDAKTFWSQIVWNDTLKALASGYDGCNNDDHHGFIQMLHLVKTYHFDACVCSTKDIDSSAFINKLKNLPTIFHETNYDLTMMDEWDLRDHVTQLHDAQKARRVKFDEELAFTHVCRNLPFGGRATRDSRVRVPRKEYARSRHQRLFEENVGKTEKDVIYELLSERFGSCIYTRGRC